MNTAKSIFQKPCLLPSPTYIVIVLSVLVIAISPWLPNSLLSYEGIQFIVIKFLDNFIQSPVGLFFAQTSLLYLIIQLSVRFGWFHYAVTQNTDLSFKHYAFISLVVVCIASYFNFFVLMFMATYLFKKGYKPFTLTLLIVSLTHYGHYVTHANLTYWGVGVAFTLWLLTYRLMKKIDSKSAFIVEPTKIVPIKDITLLMVMSGSVFFILLVVYLFSLDAMMNDALTQFMNKNILLIALFCFIVLNIISGYRTGLITHKNQIVNELSDGFSRLSGYIVFMLLYSQLIAYANYTGLLTYMPWLSGLLAQSPLNELNYLIAFYFLILPTNLGAVIVTSLLGLTLGGLLTLPLMILSA